MEKLQTFSFTFIAHGKSPEIEREKKKKQFNKKDIQQCTHLYKTLK